MIGRLAVVLVAVAGVGQAPAAASTAKLAYEEPIPGIEEKPLYALTVEAAPGEANGLTVAQNAHGYAVRDQGAAIRPGAGCVRLGPEAVWCPTRVAGAAHTVFVAAGDRGDGVAAQALPKTTFVEVRGGAGKDFVVAGPGRDLLFGGSGADWLVGGPGNDRIDGGTGDDGLDGAGGSDRVLYETRRAPVRVDLAAGTGGQAGERDVIVGVEEILGGLAADELYGDSGPNVIIGGGGGGRDTLSGRAGNDHLSGHSVQGGPGGDVLGGSRVRCGTGRDLIVHGAEHTPRGPFSRTCDLVLAIFVTLRPDPVRRSSRWVEYAVTCLAPRCTGTLELRDRRGRLGRKRFALRHDGNPAALHRVRVPVRRRPAQRVAKLRISGPRAYQRDWFRTRVRPSRNQ